MFILTIVDVPKYLQFHFNMAEFNCFPRILIVSRLLKDILWRLVKYINLPSL